MNSGKMLVNGVPDVDGEPVVKENRMRGSKRKRMDIFRIGSPSSSGTTSIQTHE